MGQAGTRNAKKCVWESDPPYVCVQPCQTKPIQPGRPADGARTGQMRETKPNLGKMGHPRDDRVKQSQSGGPTRAGVYRAKQSQFAAPEKNRWGKPHRTSGRNCAKQTQFRRSGRTTKCLVEKDLWRIEHARGLGETKPISARQADRWTWNPPPYAGYTQLPPEFLPSLLRAGCQATMLPATRGRDASHERHDMFGVGGSDGT